MFPFVTGYIATVFLLGAAFKSDQDMDRVSMGVISAIAVTAGVSIMKLAWINK